jgi:predicted unusual protein kinase regulating ubiquinone biosynthesis (AarF/ABC1/UbiB family)
MPEEYIEELGKLQDEVPPVDFEEIKALAEKEFGRPLSEVFAEFEQEPEGAASLAQVHKATLPTGERVAVKIQRPYIEELINIDLGIFSYLMDGLNRFTRAGKRYDIPGIVAEFARTLGDEIDFYREGFYAERFRQNFESSEIIKIPKVYWAYTKDRVLTLEAVEGIRIWDFDRINKAHIDRNQVAYEILQSFLQMVLSDGFFHADPHPGNLFVIPGPVITYVDFGMVGEITPEKRETLKQGAIAVVRNDVDGLIASLAKLGFIRRSANLEPIKRTFRWLFDNYSGLTSRDFDFQRLEAIQEDVRKIVYEQPFAIPSEFAFLGRAGGTIVGLITGLDPEFDFVESARPYMQGIKQEVRLDVTDLIAEEAKKYAQIFLNLPKQVQKILSQLEKGNLVAKIDTTEIVKAIGRSDRSNLLNSFGLVLSSLVIGGVLLVVYGYGPFSYILFGLAFLILVGMLLARP